jgi:hypothetical protein
MAWRFGSKCSGHYYWFKRLFRVAGVGQLLAAQSSQRFQPDHHTDALSRERKRQWVNNPLFQRVPLPSAERQRSIFVLLIIIQESRPITSPRGLRRRYRRRKRGGLRSRRLNNPNPDLIAKTQVFSSADLML